MPARTKNLTGIRFHWLTAIERVSPVGSSYAEWLCRCDCGNTTVVAYSNLKQGTTKSCGCMRAMLARTKALKHGHTRYDGTKTPTYRSWSSMKQRCLNPNATAYERYGGRGITVCERWMTFANFLEDMGVRPDGVTLDRIDPDGDYTPENCRWSTSKEQRVNRSKRKGASK